MKYSLTFAISCDCCKTRFYDKKCTFGMTFPVAIDDNIIIKILNENNWITLKCGEHDLHYCDKCIEKLQNGG